MMNKTYICERIRALSTYIHNYNDSVKFEVVQPWLSR